MEIIRVTDDKSYGTLAHF